MKHVNMKVENLLIVLKKINSFCHKLVYTKYYLANNVLCSCGMHESGQSLSTHHTTWQYSLKKWQNMVIIPTYCEINDALISY